MKNIIYLVCLISITNVHAANNSDTIYDSLPQVGKPIPEFHIERLFNYDLKTAKASDFKGKWLFLDFWTRGCTSCITSMPKISKLQRSFRDNAVFLMVGKNDRFNYGIENLYERIRVKQNLQMPYAFDSILIEEWNVGAVPHIIIINPDGIVYAITDGRDMTTEKVARLMKGEKVSFYEKNKVLSDFDPVKYASENTGNIIFQSLLCKWNNEKQKWMDIDAFLTSAKSDYYSSYQLIMTPALYLYNVAYLGKPTWDIMDSLYTVYCPIPVFEVKSDSIFKYDFGKSENGITGMFNYTFKMPVSNMTKSILMSTMQQDMKKSFGYNVSIETREMPVWKLIVLNEQIKNKLRSKGERLESAEQPSDTVRFTNQPMKSFLQHITHYIANGQMPFIDVTGINFNIDIIMSNGILSLEDIRKGLQQNGLDLIKGTYKMKTLVIKDSK